MLEEDKNGQKQNKLEINELNKDLQLVNEIEQMP